jgi:hypothetical protein
VAVCLEVAEGPVRLSRLGRYSLAGHPSLRSPVLFNSPLIAGNTWSCRQRIGAREGVLVVGEVGPYDGRYDRFSLGIRKPGAVQSPIEDYIISRDHEKWLRCLRYIGSLAHSQIFYQQRDVSDVVCCSGNRAGTLLWSTSGTFLAKM